MSNLQGVLEQLLSTDGCVGVSLVDASSGMLMGQAGGNGFDMEVAAATNTMVLRAKRDAVKSLQLPDEIEDILITLTGQYHLLRPLKTNDLLFLYMVLDRSQSNLALARHNLAKLETVLEVE